MNLSHFTPLYTPSKVLVLLALSCSALGVAAAEKTPSLSVVKSSAQSSISQSPLSAQSKKSAQPGILLPAALLKLKTSPRIEHANDKAMALATLPGLNSASQVVQVQALKLPPASEPLPQWMQNIAVPVPLEEAAPTPIRIAQDTSAKALRQPAQPVTSSDQLPNQIEVAAGTYIVLVTTSDLQTAAIADPSIADITVVNSRALLINGKSVGATTLVVVDQQSKIRQYQIGVADAPGTRPVDIESEIGIETVRVRRIQDSLILEGEVASSEEMKRALDIAGIFSEKTINQLRVRVDEKPAAADSGQLLATQIQEALDRPDITVRAVDKTVILDGTVANESEKKRAEQIARTLSEGEVLNLLALPRISVEEVRKLLGAAAEPSAAEERTKLGLGTIGIAQASPELVARQVGEQIILEGTVLTKEEIDDAIATASLTGLQVVNRLKLAPGPYEESALLNRVAAAIGLQGVRVRGTEKRLMLEGTVPDTNTAVRAGQIALGFAPNVDNMLEVANPTLINVEISIVEISKEGYRSLGVSFPDLVDSSTDFSGGQALGTLRVGSGQTGRLGTGFKPFLRAQIDNGSAQLLANPRATVLSGRTASFQAGGQIPIPVDAQVSANGLTTVKVEFKDFGVLMDVTPIANEDGIITMRVRTDITQLDPNLGSITVAPGVSIPAFTRRAAVTEVTTRTGGTTALSGLITNDVREAARKVPLLGNIPILGKLFSSKRYQRNESDLVIFVTPRVLPNMLETGETAPSTAIAVGPSTVAATTMGNPGIQTFSTIGGTGVQPPPAR